MRPISRYSLVIRRQRRKQAVLQSLRQRLSRVALGCGSIALLALVFGLLVGSIGYVGLVKDLPSVETLPVLLDPQAGLFMQPTRIYDRSGQVLIKSLENPGISRNYLYLDPDNPERFSPELIRAVVGYFDPTYWQGFGISLRKLTEPQPVTIPERLASELLLWQEPPGLSRSLRMRLLAVQMVSRYGHVQVLEWYLNSVNFGHLAYGADSAANLYLGKSAASVDLAEAAVLAAAIQSPALNPLDAPLVALRGQQEVLQRLAERSVIQEDDHLRAAAALLILNKFSQENQMTSEENSVGEAFTQIVIDRLSQRIGRERLERGGLKVITTLDIHLQNELACLTRVQLERLVGEAETQENASLLPDGSPCQSARLLPALSPTSQAQDQGIQASAVVLDSQTGQVLALVGDTGVDGNEGLLLSHQPGSLLTPFAAVASFARGIGPASLGWDIPSSLPDSLAGHQNPDSAFHGPTRLRMAIANDYLVPLSQIVEQIGAQNVWRIASAMGLSSLADETSAELIFTGGQASPLELAQGYAVFASQGYRTGQRLSESGEIQPAVILYVEDLAGDVWIDSYLPEIQAVASAQLTYLVHDVLSDATARWPSLGYPNPFEIGRPSAAKLGRISGGRQIWAAGYTPQRVAVFWLGLPGDGEQRLDPEMVAGMWYALMQYSHRALPAEDWLEPTGVTRIDVCDPSGQLPTSACPEVVSEIFLTGSEPSTPDTLYQEFQINRETGRLATVFTPVSLVEEKIFMVVPQSAREWANAAGLSIPPQEYDAIQPPTQSEDVRFSTPQSFSYVQGKIQIKGSASGDGFRFYQLLVGQGINPQTWLQIGVDGASPVIDGVLGSWDTTGTEGLYAIRLLVARQDQSVETTTIQVTVDNTPPLVRVTYPIEGQEILSGSGQPIIFQTDISDSFGINRIEWLVDGRTIGDSGAGTYAYAWEAATGEHILEVRAFDQAGNQGSSQEIRFVVTASQ